MLLGIDTCGSTGTITLARAEGSGITVLGAAELAGKTYSAMLAPRLRDLLAAHHVALKQIEAIVVVNGPGSFTGVRVGVSAVKGLAGPFATPVIAVSRLRVLAAKARTRYAALDAGRGEFYFRDDASGLEGLLSLNELHAELRGHEEELAICEEKMAVLIPQARLLTPPTASDALLAALPRVFAADFDDTAALDGNYLRRSDAEVFGKVSGQAR